MSEQNPYADRYQPVGSGPSGFVAPAWAPPVSGFVLALLIPIVGVFVCHSQRKDAERIGQDNALARAGYFYSLVVCIIAVAVLVLYVLLFVVLAVAVSNAR